MDHLGMTRADLEKSGGYWTAQEISQQPRLWAQVAKQLAQESEALGAFLRPLVERKDLRVVFTGAGTSAFVGECLAPALTRAGRNAAAVATTDLVASPAGWLVPSCPMLLVSFARSGNSPESVAALALVEQCAADVHHLIITCNGEGALYRRGLSMPNAHVLLLPEETNDRGFAMTSSFSSMLLAASLALDLLPGDAVDGLSQAAGRMLAAAVPLAAGLVRSGYERVVYLGSNELKGLAREGALKMLELSDGRVVALSETPLGFRHGPKTIVNPRTLIVLLLGSDIYTRAYDRDVLAELRADGIAARVIALTAGPLQPSAADSAMPPGPHADDVVLQGAAPSDLALCFPYAVFVQTLALLQSLALGLKADQPNSRGVVNRVVQGVTIYPWDPKR